MTINREPERSSGLSPAETATLVGDKLLASDLACRSLGIRLVEIGPGSATLAMTVREDMLNGFQLCHGGFITALADSAFAFACNSHNELTLAAGLTVDFLAPARAGDLLTAQATEVSLAGRIGVYDVVVSNQDGEHVAVVRGRSHRIKGRPAI
ncbi:MAG: hydroxyphenylacetyl-CoA thioesterase PaaI [Burkholderiaceae bacterium]